MLAILVGCQPTTNLSGHALHSISPTFQYELIKLRQELDPDLPIPYLADDALPGSLLLNQGWQCGGIGKNTQILALISGHLHQGCQSKIHLHEVHSLGKDIYILMENQLRHDLENLAQEKLWRDHNCHRHSQQVGLKYPVGHHWRWLGWRQELLVQQWHHSWL
jgi:hypothetical protein